MRLLDESGARVTYTWLRTVITKSDLSQRTLRCERDASSLEMVNHCMCTGSNLLRCELNYIWLHISDMDPVLRLLLVVYCSSRAPYWIPWCMKWARGWLLLYNIIIAKMYSNLWYEDARRVINWRHVCLH